MSPTPKKGRRANYFLVATFILAVVALIIALKAPHGAITGTSPVTALNRIVTEGTIRIGHEGYPPYVIRDPGSDSVSGYSVDLANFIAGEAGWKIKWVATSPETKIPDLISGRFDVMVEPIFQTIPRATKVAFSRPYAFFGYAAGIVKAGENRFATVKDVDQKGVTVVVIQGYTDQAFADRTFSQATVRPITVTDAGQLFAEVVAGRADIALADAQQVAAFAKTQPGRVKALWVENPPASVAAGFMLRHGDLPLMSFLNAAIEYAETNGVLAGLNKRYDIVGVRPGGK